MKALKILFGVIVLTLGGAAFAADAAAGKAKSATCVACHGEDGIGTQPEYPNLAGQQEAYLVSSTKAYRDGAREDKMMAMFVMKLSDEDIADIAAYYASL